MVVGDELSDESGGDASFGNGVDNGDAPAAQTSFTQPPSAQPPSGGTTVHLQLPSPQSLLAPMLGSVGQQATKNGCSIWQ